MDILFHDMFTFTELFVIYIAQVFHGFSNLHVHTINGFVNVMTVAILIETKKKPNTSNLGCLYACH